MEMDIQFEDKNIPKHMVKFLFKMAGYLKIVSQVMKFHKSQIGIILEKKSK